MKRRANIGLALIAFGVTTLTYLALMFITGRIV